MKMKPLALILAFLGVFALASNAQAQRIQLLIEDDQLLKNGRNAVHSGNLEKAKFYYEEALKRKSLSRVEMVAVHNDLCVTYMYLEFFEKAIVQCKASLNLQSNKWETLNNLGTVYLVMGKFPEAINVYEKALRMKPKSKILLFNMEIALSRAQAARIKLEIEEEKRNPGEDFQDQESADFSKIPQK